MKLERIKVESIEADTEQPRKYFNQVELQELADSIKSNGILQPLTVRPAGKKKADAGRFVVVMGERRLRAAKLAGMADVPCIVRDAWPDGVTLAQLVENLQRADLNALEVARALKAATDSGVNPGKLAELLGCSKARISQQLAVLDAPASWHDAMTHAGHCGTIASERAIRELLRLKILDTASTVKPSDRLHWPTWLEVYGASALHYHAFCMPIRTAAGCRDFADRVMAWLAYGFKHFADVMPGGATMHVVDTIDVPAFDDCYQAAMFFDQARPSIDRLNDQQRAAIAAAAERIGDFNFNPYPSREPEKAAA